MKTRTKNTLALGVLAAGLCAALPRPSAAQTFKVLHDFTSSIGGNNYDGSHPQCQLVAFDNILYGTTTAGGTNGVGTIFRINTDGTGFTVMLQSGAQSGFILSGGTLYGTSWGGGAYGYGAVYKIGTNGAGFSILHSFLPTTYPNVNSGGAYPYSPVALSGSTLYGTALSGGAYGYGTVFKLSTSGGGFTVLHNFTSGDGYAYGGLLVLGNNLFGADANNGSSIAALFSLTTAGTGFTTLQSVGALSTYYTFLGSPISVGGKVYEATQAELFAINPDGTGFTNLHSLGTDGSLISSGNTLYGTTYNTVFAMNTDGSGFTNLHTFSATDPVLGTNYGGADLEGGLALSGNVLYGTAKAGGAYGNGTIFSITLPVVQAPLRIAAEGTNAILTWPTTPVGFTLQSATNLVPPITWTNVSPPPILINGLNTVTNPLSTSQQFYRLAQ